MDPNAPSPSDPLGLLDLATELILMIGEDLGPGGRFRLSQTNQRLREIFYQDQEDWKAEVSTLPYHKRLEFWTSVTKDNAGLVVCRSSLGMGLPCIRRPDVDDYPRFSLDSFGAGVIDPRWYLERSGLRRHHIRTALKLHRLQPVHPCLDVYFDRILSAAKKQYIVEVTKQKITWNPWLFTPNYMVQPKQRRICETAHKDTAFSSRFKSRARIVDGRFLLWMGMEASGQWEFLPKLDLGAHSLCPHSIWRYEDSRIKLYQEATVIPGGKRPHPPSIPLYYRSKGGCHSCLTDYDVVVEPELFRVEVWYDLGGEGDEDDVCFAAHVNEGTRQFVFSRHKHGTIEEMFNSGSKK